MQPGPQFALLPPEVGSDTVADLRNRRVAPGGQMELPFREDVTHLRASLPSTAPSPELRLRMGEHPVDVFHGGTLPMLVTGDEVRHQFQALDGDRMGNAKSTYVTNAPSRIATHRTAIQDQDGEWHGYKPGARVPKSYRRELKTTPEADDELYARKHFEASRPREDYEHGSGVADAINKSGYDLSKPVSLATGVGGSGGSARRGSQGKFQVLGGHHRVAVMSEEHPRQLLSAQWAPDIETAQRSRSY